MVTSPFFFTLILIYKLVRKVVVEAWKNVLICLIFLQIDQEAWISVIILWIIILQKEWKFFNIIYYQNLNIGYLYKSIPSLL